jgi:DNA-binding Xre family transcriptional regulator
MDKITTRGGETLVILPLDDYQRLVDAADIAAARAVAADVAAGRDEMVPADVVQRLVAGENPIRVWREHRKISARDLAAKAGISAAYLSEVETSKKDGSVTTVKNIAEALGVSIEDLI